MSYLHDPGVTIPNTPAATLASGQFIPVLELDGTAKHTTVAGLAAFCLTNLIGIDPITTPVANTAFAVTGPVVNFTSTALDYSVNGGTTWGPVSSPVFTAGRYSFTAAGLASGVYSLWVRDHTQTSVIGVLPAFVVA